jgi:hypothetical protein
MFKISRNHREGNSGGTTDVEIIGKHDRPMLDIHSVNAPAGLGIRGRYEHMDLLQVSKR